MSAYLRRDAARSPQLGRARELFTSTHLVRGATAGQDSGLTWFRTNAPHEELNAVLAVAGDRIDDAVRAMGDAPALWHSWPGDPRFDVEPGLRKRGFRFVEEEPVMVLSLDDGHASPPVRSVPGLQIQRVTDRESLTEWVRVWTGRTDPDLVAPLADKGLGRSAVVQHLLARLHGKPVGCAAAVLADSVVGIEHVITSERHRGHGVGTALTIAAVEEGRTRCASAAVLTASPDGLGIYRRLGFEEHAAVRRFARWPAGSDCNPESAAPPN
ncbi:GNAT family N-acetyltransferase [Leifsonia sp. fls2-241-R2A-40a]|uniref:GNAT family N-acetyltransferase n=1 Tax=Leifsonia sp. fls2-241-R2A-40a TaxID=3040290 RepID=UPI00254C9AFD|nr:GNAT family N-acetyltransferase [Leifsonia sp. fls2-241-R2A-40a]